MTGVGEEEFKSESWLSIQSADNSKISQMMRAHKATSGGFVCGEVKLAIALRILSGGSYLDVSEIFHVTPTACYKMLHKVLKEWICDNRMHKIDINEYLNNKSLMDETATEFSESSDNHLKNVIGALDGWLVRIKCPSSDEVKNPGNYHCRKGFYALNVQVIVDKKKRVLWHSIKSIGKAHDSAAFKSTALYKQLLLKAKELSEGQYFFIGDSAYGLRSFLITPYDNAKPNTPNDDFNFYLSSARISIECAFGEIDMRWGIFWKRLSFSLENTVNIIDAALRLHNFIVNFRENEKKEKINKKKRKFTKLPNEFDEYELDCTKFSAMYPEELVGVFGDNQNDERKKGRLDKNITELRNLGSSMRDYLRDSLDRNGMKRIRKKRYKRNQNNHVISLHNN